ncbi:hypothetical protein [Candidatus Nitrosotenuis sp. DW1]|uniref:hypothetical protein n=1 Tax=Candidatus Nitrosotenuis sp. DW1 TaxID=2259672 RepID=UPI0015CA43D4|nr:hypothetical protein [Candidatus Nitrosotenuis sp. DW1]QLH09478.1 hypothetical protein DSQ19_08315 [Candidatus Nitrosotenuis sp. DW1]
MAKPILLIIMAVPIILAGMIAIPMIINPQIPFSATNADDRIAIELTRHDLKKVSFGLTDRLSPVRSEILIISNEGNVRYLLTENEQPLPERTITLQKDEVKKLTAMIKETGFMNIPIDSIPADESVSEYMKFSLKVTLNGNTKQIQWSEGNATSTFVPPIITMVESELERVIEKFN